VGSGEPGASAPWLENLENLRQGHMVTEEPVNLSDVTRVMCDMERWTGVCITSFGDHTGLCDVKSWVRYVTGRLLGLVPRW
jgi:hypothetical protein